MVSQAWKSLSPEQRLIWEDMSNRDKERFELEKETYTGPWKVVAGKHPSAPKRPMSAFFDFSNSRRAQFRKMHPIATNGEISSILAKVWKEAPHEVKREYIEREARLRDQYKRDIAAWTEASKGGGGPVEDEDHEESERPVIVKRENDDPENDQKPPAVEGNSNVQDQETLPTNGTRHMEQFSDGHRAARLGDFEQHNYSSRHHRSSNYAAAAIRGNKKEISEDSYSSDEKSLAPLTSTDIGGFLAAAAMLDAPDNNARKTQTQQHTQPNAGSLAARTMQSNVRKVVSQLPPESIRDDDLPKISSQP
jgi:HMG (high mobility group) box